ncbi:MAG: regulatory protein RecX [Flavihumibacter sp.]|nr:regulatory protein RecX [Flavihumibacter sp.]
MAFTKTLTKEQALQKLRQFCAYQERCHQEVKDKLYSYGLHQQQVEESISQLIEEDYLNEERFAKQYAGGKFRMKQWGKVKITYELKLKKVSAYCIKKALKELPDDDYFATLQQLATTKWNNLKGEKNRFVKMKKTQDYLLQKGYEAEWVREQLQKLS